MELINANIRAENSPQKSLLGKKNSFKEVGRCFVFLGSDIGGDSSGLNCPRARFNYLVDGQQLVYNENDFI
jgi:hypothetical protein